jgi:hypothetical protein
MKYEKLLMTFAIIAVLVAAVNLMVTLNKIDLTGNVIGEANLTIESRASIDFISSVADWGSGTVDAGQTRATLETDKSVQNGNWTDNVGPLVLENKGNTNVTLSLTISKNSTDFIGGTDPTFQLYINSSANNVSCTVFSNFSNFTDVVDTDSRIICSDFNYLVGFDCIDFDFNITIYEDALPEAKTVVLTATAVPA